MSSKTLAGEVVTVAQANGPRTVRPLIGLTGRRRRAGEVGGFPDSLADLRLDVYLVGYADEVSAAGGLPVHLPVGVDPIPYLEHLDGIVLTGGADIDPERYRAQPDGHGHYEPERDQFEFQLLDAALAKDLPVLGICRGLQVLNVHAGGSLFQDVPDHSRVDVDPTRAVHIVSFEPGSRLHGLYGQETEVNSLHHQCVDRLGAGLAVSGRAGDGTVEAVEMPGRDVLAVQWHPEMRHQREPVFAWLVEQALLRAQAPRS